MAVEVPGKIVCITGATSGIGKSTAVLFAKGGYRIIITGRRQNILENLAQSISEKYVVPVLPLCFDVRDQASVNEAIHSLDDDWRNIDILINNAGLAKGLDEIHVGDPTHWDTMIDTNVKGLLYITRAVSPVMVKNGRGFILNVCSTAGKEVYPKGNVYCATKHAVDALTKSIRLDLYKYGIRVGQVSPGHVEETEFALNRFDGNPEKAKIYEDFQPLKAKDVAEIVYFMTTRPGHVNIQDVLVMGTQQAGSNFINRSGRIFPAED